MQDRVPTYPGRVVLTPVSGQTNTFDLTRADAPVVDGTPINKATLLTDATAALLELTGNPTVNDAIEALSARAKIATGSYYGSGVIYRQSSPKTIAIGFKPFLFIISKEVVSEFAYCDLTLAHVTNGNSMIFFLGQSGAIKKAYSFHYNDDETEYFSFDGRIVYEATDSGLSFYMQEESPDKIADDATDTYNKSSALYRWIAIGEGTI